MGEIDIDSHEVGPLERAVRQDIADLDLSAPMAESYAEIAFNLARKLDSGKAVMASAAIGRELRETLQALVEAAGDNDSSDLISRLSAALHTSVRDAS